MIRTNDYKMAIQELALSGEVGLGRCSKSTVYRWARKINEILDFEKADWRVKANVKDSTIIVVNP